MKKLALITVIAALIFAACQPNGWGGGDDNDNDGGNPKDSTGNGGNPSVTASCGTNTAGGNCITGSNTIVEEARQVTAFTRLSSNVCGKLTLVQGAPAVNIRTSDNLQSLIEANVNNGFLEIKIKDNTCIQPRESIEVEVSTPSLEYANLTGGIAVDVSGAWANQAGWEFTTSGGITINVIDGNTTGKLKLQSTGDVQFNGFALAANDVEISLTGNGTARVTAAQKLDAVIIGTGRVLYKGNPVVTKSIIGGGAVINSN